MPSVVGLTGSQAAQVGTTIQAALTSTVLTVFSKEILMKALPNMRYMQFARMKRDLLATKGEKITMHRYNPIRQGKKLTEGTDIQPKTLDASTVDIRVYEFGNAVQVTELLLRVSAFDQLMIAAEQLGDDYALVTEVDLLKTLRQIPSVLFAGGKASRTALVSGDTMSTRTIRDAVELMKTKKVPMITLTDPMTGAVEQVYVCFVNPHQARGLRDDQKWSDAALAGYDGGRRIFMGEIGMYEKVIFIETTMQPVIKPTSAGATAGHVFVDSANYSVAGIVDADAIIAAEATPHATLDVHQAFMLGDYCYGYAEALPVEMRDEAPADLGRKRKIGYYSIQGSGLINPDHGLIIETL